MGAAFHLNVSRKFTSRSLEDIGNKRFFNELLIPTLSGTGRVPMIKFESW